MVLGQQPLLPFFSIEQEQDQCWLYWGSLTGLYLSPGGLRAVWALSWGPTTQVPVTSANVDPKLCCGLWPILSGLRPDHLTDSYWTALGGTELPVLSGGAWELCVCCSQLPALPADTSRPCLWQDQSECCWAFLKEAEENLGRETYMGRE